MYEMLSGRRAFHGDTTMDTMTAILREDPPDLAPSARHTPPALSRIVDKCLEKVPAARFQSAGDLAFALEGASTVSGTHASAAVTIRERLATNTRLAWTVAAALGVLIALLLAAGTPVWRSQAAAAPGTSTLARLTIASGR